MTALGLQKFAATFDEGDEFDLLTLQTIGEKSRDCAPIPRR
jgi:hypothetical protein